MIKKGLSKFILAILWYTFIILGIAIIIDSIAIIKALYIESLSVFIFILIFLLFELVCFIATIKLLRDKFSKYLFFLIIFYWVAQIIAFGIKGNIYAFTTGPEISVFIKYIGTIEWGHFFKFWSQEFSIKLNTDSNRVYFGVNIIPLILSIALVYLNKKINRSTD